MTKKIKIKKVLLLFTSFLIISCGSNKPTSNNQTNIGKNYKKVEKLFRMGLNHKSEKIFSIRNNYSVYPNCRGLFQKINKYDVENYFSKNTDYQLISIDDTSAGVAGFQFIQIDDYQVVEKNICRNAIIWSIRGMPLPRVYFDDVNTAILKCQKCCKEELESSYYQKVKDGIMKRETFLTFFPNSKYSEYAKKDLEDMKNGKDIRDGVIDPIADIQKTVDIAGKVYENSVVGQTIKEFGKNLPQNSTTANLNTDNYEVLEQININRFVFTEENPSIGTLASLYLSIGCKGQKHQTGVDNEGFNATFTTNGKTIFSTSEDKMANLSPEIRGEQFWERHGAIVNISFYSSDEILTSIKLKFKRGGNYRIEIYPNK